MKQLAPPLWDFLSLSKSLGPKFAGPRDSFPTNWGPRPDINPAPGIFARMKPYQVGENPLGINSNYCSETGQVAYAPDNTGADPGFARWQAYANYNHGFAEKPVLDAGSGGGLPEPILLDPSYVAANGGALGRVIMSVRGQNPSMVCNDAIFVTEHGFVGVAGTQTTGGAPYPWFKFPATKVPTAIAITSGHELLLVTVWDTASGTADLAVFMLEAANLSGHTMRWMGMPNEGDFSGIKLLGYVPLPAAMTMPDKVGAASNGYWNGASQTDGLDLGSIDISQAKYSNLLLPSGAWSQLVATGGYALVSSKAEGLWVLVDLAPVFAYIARSWLSNYRETAAARGAGDSQWPVAFSGNPSIIPLVGTPGVASAPTCVLCGQHTGRWSTDIYKAYIGTESGDVWVIDTSAVMARFSWEKKSKAVSALGSFSLGTQANPTDAKWARYSESTVNGKPLPLIPAGQTSDGLNGAMYFACRGLGKVVGVISHMGQGVIYRDLGDIRVLDPVAVSVAGRANIISVADFTGLAVHSFRVGALTDVAGGKKWGAGADGTEDFEYAGKLPLAGGPFSLSSVNVN